MIGDKCLFCSAREDARRVDERCYGRDVSLGDGRTLHSSHVFAHQWRKGGDSFASWRDCLSCGKREFFLMDLP